PKRTVSLTIVTHKLHRRLNLSIKSQFHQLLVLLLNYPCPSKMATTAALLLRRTTTTTTTLRHRAHSTLSASTKPSHHQDHSHNHVYLKPTTFIGSFLEDQPPQNPKEAAAKLALLRREYGKQVKGIRKQLIDEMELQRLEKLRKDEARTVEMLKQREERKKSKAAAAHLRAAHRKAFQDDFRLTLMKEKAEKLEYWRKREKAVAEKKKNKKELICQQSSKWIDEKILEPKIVESIVDSKVL
ncbi:hypothetical protein KSS87_007853, partial [Heliosperma pusillum]